MVHFLLYFHAVFLHFVDFRVGKKLFAFYFLSANLSFHCQIVLRLRVRNGLVL